jgi:hypothetical protein
MPLPYSLESFFLLAKFSQKANFFNLWPISGEIWTQKKLSCRQKFIHFNHFSSTFRAFIQHLDELASGYVLVVPPGRKTKNHRKNTDLKVPHLLSPSTKVVQVAAAYTATVSL